MLTLGIIHVWTQSRNFTIQLGLRQYVSIAQLNSQTPHKSIILNVKHVLIFLKSKSYVHYFYISFCNYDALIFFSCCMYFSIIILVCFVILLCVYFTV